MEARFVAAGVIALIPAIIKAFYYQHNIGSDDAYIHIRIVTELLRGEGWGINPHHPVNLSTAPAFTLLLAFVQCVTSHGIAVTQALSEVVAFLGLVAIYGAAFAETRSVRAAFLAEITAAFSVNLWRWNGTLMEATFAFAMVALLLYMLRRGKQQGLLSSAWIGLLLGVGILLRPEMGLLSCLALLVLLLRSKEGTRIQNVLSALWCAGAVMAVWVFCTHRLAITLVPTTYAAKSVHGILLMNGTFIKQFVETLAESLLLPLAFVFAMVAANLRSGLRRWKKAELTGFILPFGWVFGLCGFYYLKTNGLQSAGRYLLPLLPCEVLILALLWMLFEDSNKAWQHTGLQVALLLNAVFALELNQRIVAPVLRRFETQYGDTMRMAANELAQRTERLPNKRVLVVEDIGALSVAGDGRFEIFDGGALATPSIGKMTLCEQIRAVEPAYIVESLSTKPEGFADDCPGYLHMEWEKRFLPHSVRSQEAYLYTIIFSVK